MWGGARPSSHGSGFSDETAAPMTLRLDILVHDLDPFDTRFYVVKQCIPLWKQDGIACHVRRGLQEPRRADAVFLHVDLTRVPEAYVAAGMCPACGYDIASARVEADGCRVCPECGGAWRGPTRSAGRPSGTAHLPQD